MSEQFEEHEIEDALAAALRVLRRVKNANGYDELASMIALRYALRSDFDRAVEIADTINDPFTLDKTVGEIAVMLAAAGQEDGAFELIESLEDFSHQSTSTSQIAIAHAGSGDFDRAIEIASGMEDNASTLVEIAYQCTAKEEFTRALEIIEMLDFPQSSAWARINIADKYIQRGRVNDALELLSQALDNAHATDPANERAGTLTELAVKYAEAGQDEMAGDILSQAIEVATSADEIYRDAALSQIAAGYARLKHYDEAVTITEKIDSVYHATATLIDLAAIEHEADGRQAEALQLLSDAYDLIVEDVPETQTDETQHNHLLLRIAVLNAYFGQADQALKAAQSIGAQDEKHQALSSIATHLAQAGTLDEALTVARKIEDKTYRARNLIGISRIIVAAGTNEKGVEILAEAKSLVEGLEVASDRVLVLTGLLIAYREAGQLDRIASLFTDALADTKLITGEYQKTLALLSIAEACARTEYELDEESKEMLWEISAV